MADDTPAPRTVIGKRIDGSSTYDDPPSPDPDLGSLGRDPVIDRIPEAQVSILAARSGGRLTRAELNAGLELAVRYGLDPWANEIWFTKGEGRNGQPGKVLIMVGRDGLRKIAERNGLHVEGDVVREKDTYEVEYVEGSGSARTIPARHRVTHKRSGFTEKDRGPIVGAWCRVTDAHAIERGWFEAPLSEYLPANVSSFSPWSHQVSAMILGAAERQAIRQATPLGGLVHEGEADINLAAGDVTDLPAPELPQAVLGVIDVARRVGHAALSDADTVAMQVAGRDDEYVAKWVADAMDSLDNHTGLSTAVWTPVEGGGGTTVPVDADGDATADVQPVDPDREQAGLGDWDPELNARLEAEAAQEDQR